MGLSKTMASTLPMGAVWLVWWVWWAPKAPKSTQYIVHSGVLLAVILLSIFCGMILRTGLVQLARVASSQGWNSGVVWFSQRPWGLWRAHLQQKLHLQGLAPKSTWTTWTAWLFALVSPGFDPSVCRGFTRPSGVRRKCLPRRTLRKAQQDWTELCYAVMFIKSI